MLLLGFSRFRSKLFETSIRNNNSRKQAAFTLAEVLITLGIIGVVAAMTLPTVVAKYKKQATISELKKIYSVISQAVKRSELDNGELSTWPVGSQIQVEEYFNKYWKPYLKEPKICIKSTDCGYSVYSYPYKYSAGETVNWNIATDSTRTLFELADGTIIFMPRNTTDKNGDPVFVQYFFVDINGAKQPNTLGKDVFVFIFDYKKGVVQPYGYEKSYDKIESNCKSAGEYCFAKIVADGWEIKDDYPLKF